MHAYALLYNYTMSVNLYAYASHVAWSFIFLHAYCVFVTFLGSVPVILLYLLLASNVFLILFCTRAQSISQHVDAG